MADFAIRKLEESAIQNSDQIELNSVEISKLNKERNCFKSANEKLAKYVVKGAQPGMPMFKLARLFDLYQVLLGCWWLLKTKPTRSESEHSYNLRKSALLKV